MQDLRDHLLNQIKDTDTDETYVYIHSGQQGELPILTLGYGPVDQSEAHQLNLYQLDHETFRVASVENLKSLKPLLSRSEIYQIMVDMGKWIENHDPEELKGPWRPGDVVGVL